ncbi:MAG: type 1 glutamine amidotransferase [Proteobacteria bacterium]|nr:type 1 glutamine amidotransferase [Pseudomonadota bacterium]
MNILVVQHQNLGGPEAFGAALEERGARLDIRNAEAGDGLPADSAGHDALLVLGGTMSANQDTAYPYILQSLELIRDFHGQAKPVLGICLGAQLIARAFGGRVEPHDAPELGFIEVVPNHAASADPLLAGLDQARSVMQWHYDSFELPPAARLLATSRTCRNQAFRMAETTHGFQFHFEVSRALVENWLASSVSMPDDAVHEDFKARIGGELDRHVEGSLGFCRDIADRWTRLIAGRRVD